MTEFAVQFQVSQLKQLEKQLIPQLVPLDIGVSSKSLGSKGPIFSPDKLVKHCLDTITHVQRFIQTLQDDQPDQTTIMKRLVKQQEDLIGPHDWCQTTVQDIKSRGDQYIRTLDQCHNTDVRQALQSFLGGLSNFTDFFDQLTDDLKEMKTWEDLSVEDFEALDERLREKQEEFAQC